jgi:hypothetical protein
MIRFHGLRLLLGALAICATTPSWGAPAAGFHLQEASIADVHGAILARQLTATQLVGYYLKRIEAYNGPCVRGAVDPATGRQLGDIQPIENAGKVNALITLNLRGKRSETDKADTDARLPDALETAAALDAEFALTGKLKGPLHGIPGSHVTRTTVRRRTRPSSRVSVPLARSFWRNPISASTRPATAARMAARPAIPTTRVAAPDVRAAAPVPLSRPIW